MLRKVFIFVGASLLIVILWWAGLEKVYAHLLSFATNIFAGMGSSQTSIKVEDNGELIFRVTTLVEGRRGSYPQQAQTLLLPAVMVLSWQVLLFFGIPWRVALRTAGFNLLLFLGFHVVFLLLLTSYYNSSAARFFFHLMMETFYILALVIIIKDSIKYPGIWGKKLNHHADKR